MYTASIHRGFLIATLLVPACLDRFVQADDSAKKPTPDKAAIQRWIEELNSEHFRVRAAATQKLLASGDAAIEALTAAAKSPHAEVALRATDILEKLTKPKLIATASGLKYRIVKVSKQPKPVGTSKVTVHYKGWLDDGTEFDSSHKRGKPMTFALTSVIPGWAEGLQLIGKGGVIELEVPAKLAYGDRRVGPIPANAALHFRIELIDFK